ncbi:MAG: PAS domain S-box protein [Thermodesulfobacteriota bacterium]
MQLLIHILHLEDDPADAELAQALLESEGLACQINRVQTGDEFREALSQGGYDVILADFRLPGYDGMSALRLVQEMGLDIPFIFVSGTMGEDAAIEGLREGAIDYVLKQKLSRLVPAVKRALGEAENRRERQRAEAALRQSEERYRSLVENIDLGIILISSDYRILMANAALGKFFHKPVSEFLGKECFREFEKRDAVCAHCPGRRAMATGEVAETETDGVRDDGTIFMVHNQAFPNFGPDGEITGFIEVVKDITERKRGEAALRKSEEKYRLLVKQIPAVVFKGYADGSVDFFDDKIATLTGYSKEDFCSRRLKWPDLITPEDQPGVRERLIEALKTNGAYERQYRIRKKSGEIAWLQCMGQIFFDAAGRMDFISGVIYDITFRKQTEEELVRAKEEWELTFNSVPHLIAILDTQHRIVRANQAMAAKLGIPPEEAVGRRCFEAVHKTAGPPHFCPHTKLLADGREHTAEILEENLGGYFLVTVSPLRDSRGNLLGSVHIARDITEQKKAAAAMAHLSRQMELILNSAGEGIFGVDTEGKLTFANPAMAQMLGWEIFELLGQSVHDLCHHTKRNGQPYPSGECPINLAFKNGRIYHAGDEWFWRKDGTSFPVEYTSTPIREGDQVVGTVVVIKDISERKQAEEAKLKFEAQLRQAQKMEAIGTLAGGIAHDFNNILGAIIGYGEMIQMFHTSLDPKVKRDVDEILRAAFRAKDLVQQILTFSRRVDQDRKPIQLQMIIKESIKFLRATLPSTIEIRQFLDPEVGPVLADPTQMQQVVMNLCTNAAHAMRQEGGVLEVSLSEVVVSEGEKETLKLVTGPYAKMMVKDSGHGIPPEVLERIFDPYFTTKGMGEGTGLGLAVVEGIIQSHGGAITVESEPGIGTVFLVFIPLMERSEITLPSETPAPIPQGEGQILFVDDEPSLAHLGQGLLTQLGFEVDAFTSSTAALAKFRQNPQRYDLAIVDLTMPQMTGVELTRELLQIKPDLPIILSSGFADQISQETLREMGFRDFILKPWSVRPLAETIKKVLG